MTDLYEQMKRQAERQENLMRVERSARLPRPDYERLLRDDLDRTPALVSVHGWQKSPKSGPILCLSGDIGIGKTLAAMWAIANGGGVYLHASEACRQWTAKYDRLTYEKLQGWRMLLLDDVGLEGDPAAMADLLICACDTRDGKRARMIMTTNLTEKQLRERYPEPRLWSRMLRHWHFVTKTGPDLRKPQR